MFELTNSSDLSSLSDDQLRDLMASVVDISQEDRKQNQILYYRPVSPKVQDFHNSKARVNALGGGNGCLPLEAPVLMADGSWKPLGEIALGDLVIAADPETGMAVPAPVTRLWRSGKKPVYRVSFSDGGSFEATAEHMVPMYLGSGRTTSKGNTKKPHKRMLGDYIEPILRRGAKNPSKRISCISPSDIQFSSHPALKIHPYVLGVLLGDGSYSESNGIRFHDADENVITRLRLLLEIEGFQLKTYARCNHAMKGKDKDGLSMKDHIRNLGLMGKNSYHKYIPSEYLCASRSDRMQLLAGLLDTDGHQNGYSTCSAQLAEDFRVLVKSLGGKATISKRIAKCQTGAEVEYFDIYSRLPESPPLSVPHKYQPSQVGREIDYQRRVCRSAELIGVHECGDIEVDHPAHCYVTGDYIIVSNSGKSDSTLAELVMCATGIFPYSQRHLVEQKFRGPIQCRLVVQSLTTTLETIILPKLQWWKWTGVDRQGGEKGHWGWIPKSSLIDGDWQKSYSQKLRLLRLICRDPENPDKVLGESSIQCMSFDQDPADFASGDYHLILHDEPPSLAIWRENEARTMRVNGRMMLAMTWPDDPVINVDWLYNEVYEPGRTGTDPQIEWRELWTTENSNLKQEAVAAQSAKWGKEINDVRIYGRPIRFSNRIHPEFTEVAKTWCFVCDKSIIPVPQEFTIEGIEPKHVCQFCQSEKIVEYNHVQEFDTAHSWPTVMLADPHPRKPHCLLWVQISPQDDWYVVADRQVDGDCVDVKKECDRIESELDLFVAQRLCDPNMGLSPASSSRTGGRPVTWVDEFCSAGLFLDLADDSDVGRSRINTMLKPDQDTLRPRLFIHPRCKDTVYQLSRYVWDNFSTKVDKDPKQTPKAKYDDMPTLIKYLANSQPNFRFLKGGATVLRRSGTRKGSY